MIKEKPKQGRATVHAARKKPATATPKHARATSKPNAEAPPPKPERQIGGKLGIMVGLLQRPEGATLDQMCDATGWQAHSVRGGLAGALKRNRGFEIASEKTDGLRIYRITGRKDPKAQ